MSSVGTKSEAGDVAIRSRKLNMTSAFFEEGAGEDRLTHGIVTVHGEA